MSTTRLVQKKDMIHDTLFVEIYEVLLPADSVTPGIHPDEPTRFTGGVVTSDQVQVSFRLQSHFRDHHRWVCSDPIQKFELFRCTNHIHIDIISRLTHGPHLCGAVDLTRVKISEDFDPKHEIAKLEPHWIDLSNRSAKIKIGLGYGRRTLPGSTRLDHLHLSLAYGGSSVTTLFKRYDEMMYAAKRARIRVSELEWKKAPFPTRVESGFGVASLLHILELPGQDHLITPWASGGCLFYHLQRERTFSLARSRIYLAELVQTLEDMNGYGYAKYNIRPLAVMLNALGHIMICDFDLYRKSMASAEIVRVDFQENRYPAPETFSNIQPTAATVVWTIGAILYEMLYGIPPFYEEDVELYQLKICGADSLVLPDSPIIPEVASDLLTQLLHKNPTNRVGVRDLSEIKAHGFFTGIDWTLISRRDYAADFIPPLTSPKIPESAEVFDLNEQEAWNITWSLRLDPRPDRTRESPEYEMLSEFLEERIIRTMKLGEAVCREDIRAAEELLAQGARCDFREDDRPRAVPHDESQCFDAWDPTFPLEFLPPLLYAILGRNADLVELLLTSGADPNASYHDLDRANSFLTEHVPILCGTVAQLAAVLGLEEITRSLVRAGARFDLPQSSRAHHQCPGVERKTWLRMVKRFGAGAE